nr:class I SAM-dependent methyltransferase [Burkholderia multivorans]
MLDDPVALMILGDTEAQALHDNIDRFREPASIGMRSSVIVRSPLADDVWRDAVERGIHLYVVLGAGLDISAFRHPDTPARIFEVNLPTTQEWKRPRLREAAIAVPPPLAALRAGRLRKRRAGGRQQTLIVARTDPPGKTPAVAGSLLPILSSAAIQYRPQRADEKRRWSQPPSAAHIIDAAANMPFQRACIGLSKITVTRRACYDQQVGVDL